jgi:hypothetical protein
LLVLAGLVVFLAMGPTPGAVLRNNAERDIQATALFYMDYEEMPELEQRLEQLLDEKSRTSD